MTTRLLPLEGLSESPRLTRRVTLEDSIGVGHGPRHEHTALLARAFENQHEVLERYYGSWAPAAAARTRDDGRERLEFAAAPDVEMPQAAEELLFRAYSLYR